MNGVLLENFLTTFNYWFTWEEVGGLTSKGKSCLLAVLRMSNHRSFERSPGAGKRVETVSRSVSEESTYAKKKKKKKQTNKQAWIQLAQRNAFQQNLHKTFCTVSKAIKKKTIKKKTVRFLFKYLSMSTRCRFLRFFMSIDWALNLPSSKRRPSLASIPESIPLSTTESDNCDWKVNKII